MSKANKGQVRSKPPEMVAAAALAELSGHSPPTSSDDDEHEELHVCESSLAQSKYEKGNKRSDKLESISDKTSSTSSSAVSFPEKLMEILTTLEVESSENEQPISWLPSGNAFVISNPSEFTAKVMPRFFSQRAEYSSFNRRLYWWGFRKLAGARASSDAFQHELFRRDKPSLCHKIKGMSRRGKKRRGRSQAAIIAAKAQKEIDRITSGDAARSLFPASLVDIGASSPTSVAAGAILGPHSSLTPSAGLLAGALNLLLPQPGKQRPALDLTIPPPSSQFIADAVQRQAQIRSLQQLAAAHLAALQTPAAAAPGALRQENANQLGLCAAALKRQVVIHVHHHKGADGKEYLTYGSQHRGQPALRNSYHE